MVKNVSINLLIVFSLLIVQQSCKTSNPGSVTEPTLIKATKAVGMDLTGAFFGEMRKLTISGDTLFGIDCKTNTIHVFDKELSSLYSFGRFGKGPGEINYPLSLFVSQNRIYLSDLSYMIKEFKHNGEFVRQLSTPVTMLSSRFTIHDTKMFYSGFGKEGPNVIYSLKTKEYSEFGDFKTTKKGNRSYPRSTNLMQFSSDKIYATNAAFPIIEVFNVNGELVKVFQVPDVPAIKARMNYASTYYSVDDNPRTSVGYIEDAYIVSDHIYLLVIDQISDVVSACDIVVDLKIKADKLVLNNHYQISDADNRAWFSTLCVNNDRSFLYAYEVNKHEILKFQLE